MAKEQKAIFIRVRPELLESRESRDIFRNLGFLPASMHLHAENTWILNISGSEEEILARMRKTTRYLVRKSLKMELELEITQDPEKCDILARLQKETVKRHKFVGFSQKLFESQLTTFGRDNQAALFIVKKGNIPLAAAIVIFYGDYVYYHHSGSTLSHPEIPASYFLQWQIILEAKRRRISFYNFWGVTPTENPKHRFYGVTLFKKGFGGEQIDWLHAHDLPTSPFYWLTYIFETLRKRSRGL